MAKAICAQNMPVAWAARTVLLSLHLMMNMVSSIFLLLLFFFIEVNLSLPSQEKWELIKGQDNIEISAYLFHFYSCSTLYCSL